MATFNFDNRILKPDEMETVGDVVEAVALSAAPEWLSQFELKECPSIPLLWKVVVQIPVPPEKSSGGIIMAKETRDNQEFASYIGVIAAMGSQCYKAVTRSGIDMSKETQKPGVGDWVKFSARAGEKWRSADGTLFITMSDTEIQERIEDPALFDCVDL